MQQKSLAVSGFEKYRKQTRKEIFLEEMNQLIPWQALTAVIEPHYPNPCWSPSGGPGTHAENLLPATLVCLI